MKSEVYRNLHADCFSVRKRGRLFDHILKGYMAHADFVVQPAGRARVLREQRKNVHAFVRGNITTVAPGDLNLQRVIYNPYAADTFTLKDGTPVYHADYVVFQYPAVYAAGVR